MLDIQFWDVLYDRNLSSIPKPRSSFPVAKNQRNWKEEDESVTIMSLCFLIVFTWQIVR